MSSGPFRVVSLPLILAGCAAGAGPEDLPPRSGEETGPAASDSGLETGVDGGSEVSKGTPCSSGVGNCYVAPTGNDDAAGNIDSPFSSISRCAKELAGRGAGTCWIRAGDYHETVAVPSGITLRAYDGGGAPELVTLRGSDRISGLGWTQVRPHVYRASVDLSSTRRRFEPQLAVDGRAFVEARWPNLTSFQGLLDRKALAVAQSGTTAGHLVGSGLPSDLVGATVMVIGGIRYGAHTGSVKAQSGSVLEYSEHGASAIATNMHATPGSGFVVVGRESLLDAPGEWFYDEVAHTVSVWLPDGQTPTSVDIEVKMRDYALDLAATKNATIKDLRLFMASVHMNESSSGNTLVGLRATYVTHSVKNTVGPWEGPIAPTSSSSTGIEISGDSNTLADSLVEYSSGHGISVFGQKHVIKNNRVRFTDYSSTLGYSIFLAPNGRGHQIVQNTLHDTARNGLGTFGGSAALQGCRIALNDVYGFGATTDDLGGLYLSNIDGATPSSGPGIVDHTRIEGNWVHDSYWTTDSSHASNGIYFDCASRGFVITHNVVWNTGGAGIQFSTCGNSGGGYYMTVNNNTIGGGQSAGVGVFEPSPGGLSNTFISNNIFVRAGGICAGATCMPGTDHGAGGYANWRGDPGFVAGTWQLSPGSKAIGSAATVWTDTAFGVDWRCAGGTPGCTHGPATHGAYAPSGWVFQPGSTIPSK